MTTTTHDDAVDTDVLDAAPIDTLALRRPATPVTVSDLAAMRGAAQEVLDARVQVISTLRVASIRATHPEDWLLFKAPDEQGGQVVGYLQDCGCDRVRDLWGIEIYHVTKPEKVMGVEPAVFHYLITGDGRCKLSQQTIESIEGGRSSTDDFCRGKVGAELELLVRKAARANLDGNITRELAGMKSVPIAELIHAWTGTTKHVEQCRRGRGFGTHSERLGARTEKAPNVDPPICPHCKTPGAYRPGKDGRSAFYGCPNYLKHQDKKWTVDADKWAAQAAAQTTPPAATAPAGTTSAAPSTTAPLTAAEVFGRTPGEEG